jgi:prepilin peptidase CpaA
MMMMTMAAVMVVMVGIAVYTDVRVGRIYNALTVPCAALGLVLNLADRGLPGLGDSAAGLAVGFGAFLLSAVFGRMLGGGDIKLLMAIGAIQGPVFLLWTIVYMALAGGVLAVVVSAWRGDFLASLRRLWTGLSLRVVAQVPMDAGEAKAKARLPYAIPIALGSVISLVSLHLVK